MTRLYNSVLSYPLIHIKNKTQYVRKNILCMLCIFLIGFLIGNLFGTILKLFQNWEIWDGFIILGLIMKIEVISYFSYKSIKITYAQDKSLARAVVSFGQNASKMQPLVMLLRNKKGRGKTLQTKSYAVPSGQSTHKALHIFSVKGETKVRRQASLTLLHKPKVCVTQRKKLALQNNQYKFDRVFWTNLNLFKIGIMVGFFVDAFKVGS